MGVRRGRRGVFESHGRGKPTEIVLADARAALGAILDSAGLGNGFDPAGGTHSGRELLRRQVQPQWLLLERPVAWRPAEGVGPEGERWLSASAVSGDDYRPADRRRRVRRSGFRGCQDSGGTIDRVRIAGGWKGLRDRDRLKGQHDRNRSRFVRRDWRDDIAEAADLERARKLFGADVPGELYQFLIEEFHRQRTFLLELLVVVITGDRTVGRSVPPWIGYKILEGRWTGFAHSSRTKYEPSE